MESSGTCTSTAKRLELSIVCQAPVSVRVMNDFENAELTQLVMELIGCLSQTFGIDGSRRILTELTDLSAATGGEAGMKTVCPAGTLMVEPFLSLSEK